MIGLTEEEFDVKNFDEVQPDQPIKFYYQNYSIIEQRWKITCLSPEAGYSVVMGQIYRKPKTVIGWLKITPQLIGKAYRIVTGKL